MAELQDIDKRTKVLEDLVVQAEPSEPQSLMLLADHLDELALLYRKQGARLLQAVNLEARGRVLRSKTLSTKALLPEVETAVPQPDRYSIWSQLKGQTLGNYVLTEMLACRDASAVFKAQHQNMEKYAVAKFLAQPANSEPEHLARFAQEARTLASIREPDIVAILDFGVSEQGFPYLLTEYVEGIDLAKAIKESKHFAEQVVIDMCKQLCLALSYLHEHGVVHRDLKPSNMIVDRQPDKKPVLKIVDFGIAKETDAKQDADTITRTGEVVGSPPYMSPEQCMGQAVDLRSDIYSFGCVIFEMLTGSRAFRANTALEAVAAHLDPARLPDLSRRLSAHGINEKLRLVVLRCLEIDKSRRFSSAHELRLALAAAGKDTHKGKPRKAFLAKLVLTLAVGIIVLLLSLLPHVPSSTMTSIRNLSGKVLVSGSFSTSARLLIESSLAKGVSLHEADLSGLNLSGLQILDYADLSGASFRDSDLSNSRLESVNFEGANFNQAKIVSAKLRNCNFRLARFIPTDMADSSFDNCSFIRAQFLKAPPRSTGLSGCQFDGARFLSGDPPSGVKQTAGEEGAPAVSSHPDPGNPTRSRAGRMMDIMDSVESGTTP